MTSPDGQEPRDREERDRLREILAKTTPDQRLAWLEEAIVFARCSGALPRREAQDFWGSGGPTTA
jgi:hypothetical protein